MSLIRDIWNFSTSSYIWGIALALLLSIIVFNICKNIPAESRYSTRSTLWGLVMTVALACELITFTGALKMKLSINDTANSIALIGGNVVEMINIDEIIKQNFPSIEKYVNAETLNRGTVTDIASVYCTTAKSYLDKTMFKSACFVIGTLILFTFIIIKTKDSTNHDRNYAARRQDYRSTRKSYRRR